MNRTIIGAIIGAVGLVLAAVIPILLKKSRRRQESHQRAQLGNIKAGAESKAKLTKTYSTEDFVLRNFFQGHLYIVRETILIIVGTSIGAERFDRVLGQLLKTVFHSSNIEADIITDMLYHQKMEKFKSNPIICIGGRSTNSVTREYEEKGEFDLKDRETTAKVFTDNQRPIAFIYGGGVKETYEATIDFCKNKMIVFLDKWSSIYTKGRKKLEIPSNIEDLLSQIIFTMSGYPFGDNKNTALS